MRTTSKTRSFGELGGGAGTSKRLVLTGRVAGTFEMKNVNKGGRTVIVQNDSAEKVIFISIMPTVLFIHLELINKNRAII